MHNDAHPEDLLDEGPQLEIDEIESENNEKDSDSEMENIDNLSDDEDDSKPKLDIDQLFKDAEQENQVYEIEEIRLKKLGTLPLPR